MADTLVINLFAGPGAGKSTMAAGLFYELKMAGYNVEMALEYAKDLTWEERISTLSIQPYVFGKQYHRICRLLGKVDAIITDSPVLLSCFYAGALYPQSFHTSVIELFSQLRNLNFYVKREKAYNPAGRSQTEEEAQKIDADLLRLLSDNHFKYLIVPGSRDGLTNIMLPATISVLGGYFKE